MQRHIQSLRICLHSVTLQVLYVLSNAGCLYDGVIWWDNAFQVSSFFMATLLGVVSYWSLCYCGAVHERAVQELPMREVGIDFFYKNQRFKSNSRSLRSTSSSCGSDSTSVREVPSITT